MPIDSQVEVKQVRLVKGTGAQITAARQAGEILETDLVAQTDAPDLVTANDAIIGATKCKITYDSKGLVTAGDDLNSSDITTALGYTPYDSTNPSGYTSNVGTVTSVNNVSPVNGNITLSIANTSLNNLDSTGQAVIDGKVDLNLNNMNPSATAKETIVGWGMPDYSAGIDFNIPTSSDSFTAPSDGVWFFNGVGDGGITRLVVNGITTNIVWRREASNYNYPCLSVYLSKGDNIYWDSNFTIKNACVFYPLKGV